MDSRSKDIGRFSIPDQSAWQRMKTIRKHCEVSVNKTNTSLHAAATACACGDWRENERQHSSDGHTLTEIELH
jgi:hypothetical protein